MTILMMDHVINLCKYKTIILLVCLEILFSRNLQGYLQGGVQICADKFVWPWMDHQHTTISRKNVLITVSVCECFTSAHSLHGNASSFCRSLLLRTVATYLEPAIVLLCSL